MVDGCMVDGGLIILAVVTAGGIAGGDLVVGRLGGRASVERRGVQPSVRQQE